MQRVMAALGLAGLLLALLPAAAAHDTVEAQELEVFVIEDEGTDAIDAYGGYDVVAVFLGGAHRSDLGAGAAGDGFYLRIELYGEPTGPTAALPNRIAVSFSAGNGTVERSITTPDGKEFTSDFDALDVTTEPLEVHVERAFLLWDSIGAAPGTPLQDLIVTTYYGTDPRDVAPGGIYVPGSGGLLTYPDPTQIDGRGRLVEDPVPPPADVYFGPTQSTVIGSPAGNGATRYAVRTLVPTALRAGAQHILVAPLHLDAPGSWNVTVHSLAQEVAANGTYVLEFTAEPAPGASDLVLELRSDVGGRLALTLSPDGSLTVRGAVTQPALEAKPAAGPPLALLAVAVALGARAWPVRQPVKPSRRTD